jgi:tetratricopeptide (TPR) repeat protein
MGMLSGLLHVLFGLAALVGGLGLIAIGVLGRIPRFLGPRDQVRFSIASYWKGRLGCLVFGLVLVWLGPALIRDPFVRSASKDYAMRVKQAVNLSARGRTDDALAILDDLVDDAPDPCVILAYRGHVLQMGERYDESHAALREAIAADPEFSWAYAIQAKTYQAQDDIKNCLASCEKALSTADPGRERGGTQREQLQYGGQSLAYYLRAWVRQFREHAFDKAIPDYQQVIDRRDELALDAAYLLGGCHYQMGRFDEALTYIDGALAKGLRQSWAHYWRGLCLLAKGDQKEALAAFEAFRLSHGDAIAAFNSLAWVMATSRHDAVRNKELAVQFGNRLRKIAWTKKADHYDTLAAVDAYVGKFDEAIAQQKKAIELAPDNEDYRKRLTLYERGKTFVARWD